MADAAAKSGIERHLQTIIAGLVLVTVIWVGSTTSDNAKVVRRLFEHLLGPHLVRLSDRSSKGRRCGQTGCQRTRNKLTPCDHDPASLLSVRVGKGETSRAKPSWPQPHTQIFHTGGTIESEIQKGVQCLSGRVGLAKYNSRSCYQLSDCYPSVSLAGKNYCDWK